MDYKRVGMAVGLLAAAIIALSIAAGNLVVQFAMAWRIGG